MIELVSTSERYAELWKTWREEPDAVLHNPLNPSTVEDLRARMSKCSSNLAELASSSEFQFFIRCDGELVGTLTLFGINPKMKYAEIGYGIGQRFQGRGLATLAVRALVEKVFEETDLRRLIAHVAEGNLASRRVLLKSGFREEGILREHFIIRGVPVNEVVFGILRSDLAN